MNFRKQCLGRHQAADYTIIMSRTLKVMGNHVMYDRGAWFLSIITSSSRALCLPSVKKQKNWLPGLLRWPSKTSKKKIESALRRKGKMSVKLAALPRCHDDILKLLHRRLQFSSLGARPLFCCVWLSKQKSFLEGNPWIYDLSEIYQH